jgi:NADPH:quinone reductase-like Zn-dependent oxidoreductase
MRAVVYSQYGGPDVLQLADVEKPTPGPNQVLVKVHAAALNPVDWHFVRGTPFVIRLATRGVMKPTYQRRVGCDYAGTVEAIGTGVTGFVVGDAVFGLGEGTVAEYLTVPADRVVMKPTRVSFEEAAAVPLAALTALQILRDKANVQPGQQVLIVGAGGGIGSFAVQLAKHAGATVTGVQSTGALDLVRSLGADRVIDYTKEDFTTGNARYDAVVDNVCTRQLSDVLRVVKPGGIFVPNGGGSPERGLSLGGVVRTLAIRPFIGQKIAFAITKPNRNDLQHLANLIEAGSITPVIDRCFPLAATADAFRHLEAGHAHGKIVITVVTAAGTGSRDL